MQQPMVRFMGEITQLSVIYVKIPILLKQFFNIFPKIATDLGRSVQVLTKIW